MFMNKPFSTRAHGFLDYIVGLLLLFAPNLLGFANVGGAAVMVPRIVGVIAIVQSIFTRYEMGPIKMLPMRMHLINDYIVGAFLAVSPWLFRFYDPANQRLWVPHLVVGLGILLVTALTEKEPRHLHLTDSERASHA
jgi:hypothetical protein